MGDLVGCVGFGERLDEFAEVAGLEVGFPGDGEVVEVLGEVSESFFLRVGIVDLGGHDGGGDLVGLRVVPEAVDVEMVFTPVFPNGY